MSENRVPPGPAGNEPGGWREFRPTTFALSQRVSVMVLLVIIAITGIISYIAIPKESRPEIVIPIISISTSYPGVSPRDMETLVTRVIEEDLNTIADLKVLSSTSIEGYSNIIAEFETSMNMEEALQKVREKVDLAKPDLPQDANEPIINEFNLSEFPIMQVNISGAYDLVRLKEVAEEVQDRLEQIPSLLEVRLAGGLEREVKVDVDLPRLQYYGLAFDDVIDAIRDENVTTPGGSIDVGNQKYLVRVTGEFPDTRIIEGIVITTKGGRPIYIRDVARVDFGFKERDSFARLDGNPVVTLDIVKRSGVNIIAAADQVKAVIAAMEPNFPATTVVKITSDESEMIHDMVSSLENNIISGLILVVAVLLFFLGVRNSSFVGISIPLSMLLSFVVMKTVGISMNMVVLFSLILALGMLVDNAIVIVENIYRFREEGHDRITASLRATGEVAIPVVASTATTVAAFFPLIFWPGITGEFMGYLPKTLIITLTSSLFVALVIVPVLCAAFMKLDDEPSRPKTPAAKWAAVGGAALAFLIVAAMNPLTAVLLAATVVGLVAVHRLALARLSRLFQDRVVPALIARYERRLRWALDHRFLVVGGAIGIFIVTVLAFTRLNAGVEFFPEDIPPQTVYAQVDVPDGTRAVFTNGIAEEIERQLGGLEGVEDAESIVATVGGGGPANPFAAGGDATVAVNFKKFEERQVDVFRTLALMQERIGQGIAGGDVTITKPADGPPSGKPVNLEIVGEDPDVLRMLGDRAVQVLESSPVYRRLEGLESDMSQGRPELVVDVDREKAALYGLTTAKVGGTVRTAIQGTEAAKFRDGNDEYDIVVRLAETYRNNVDALRDFTVVAEGGRQIPLPSVASWRIDEGYGSVRRKDMDRVVTVSSDVAAGENSNEVLGDVQATLGEFAASLPTGYTLRYTGQQEEQGEAQRFLSGAFGVALMLIAFILISQFNSVVKPVIVMTSVIMSTVGVLVGLMVFRMPFGIIMTGVGVISLAGVVVNNAIVLIDYIDVLRERGMNRREALVRAGMTRFRPVVLTAVTTVLGLVPLATGFNFDFLGFYTRFAPNVYWGGEQAAWWSPMAIAVIVGLSFATVLTLVLVPVMYSLVDDLAAFFGRYFKSRDAGESGDGRGGRQVAELIHAGAANGGKEADHARVPAAVGRLRALFRLRSAEG